jgi:hypothetical protein
VFKKEVQKTYRSNTANFTDSGVKSNIKNNDFVSSNRSNGDQSYIKFQDFKNKGNNYINHGYIDTSYNLWSGPITKPEYFHKKASGDMDTKHINISSRFAPSQTTGLSTDLYNTPHHIKIDFHGSKTSGDRKDKVWFKILNIKQRLKVFSKFLILL